MYWHVHGPASPYCLVYTGSHAQQIAQYVARYSWPRLTVISSDYGRSDCMYLDVMQFTENTRNLGGTPMTSPVLVRMPDGNDISGSDLTCEGCGSPLDGHACANGSGGGTMATVAAPVYVRRTGPRAPVTSIPTCVHCGGRIHQNLSGAAVNAECITRQYALDTGLMTDPNGRLPVLTVEMMGEIATWATTLSAPLTYGKMVSAAGGAGTYAGLRPKTGRTKKATAAAPGAQIQDMAEGVEVPAEPSSAAETKTRKNRKTKGEKKAEQNGTVAEAELAPVLETPEVIGSEPEDTGVVDLAANSTEAARAERAAKRAARKAMLAKMS